METKPILNYMKRITTNTLVLASMVMMSGIAMSVQGAVPAAPTNLTANVQGATVNLSWDATPLGTKTAWNDFEASFPGEGWSVQTKNVNDPCFTWFHYPTSNYTTATDWEKYIYQGEHSAFVQFDLNITNPGDKVLTQDEWLISPKLPGTSYVSFQFLINSVLLDSGTDPAFPNDYFLKVSRDDGKTWTNVWNARYDMKRYDDYQQAVVCLGDPCDDMRVAFVAVSDADITNAGLYFSWALDDIQFYANKPEAELVRGYNLYRNDELIAENIHYNSYTDADYKDFGDYTYKLTAVGDDGESEGVVVPVTLVQPDFNAPLNFTLTSSYDENTGSYNIKGTWDAPDGDFMPAWYEVYNDGLSCAWIGPDDPREFEQSYVPAGTYSYEVFAVYDNPFGESEHVTEWITVGGRSQVTGISGSSEGNDVTLQWGAPTAPDIDDLKSYVIRRGKTIVADNVTELTYTDRNVPDGKYRYSVSCLYKDGTESAARTVAILVNRIPPIGLPHSEDFNAGELPENWEVGTFDNMTPDDYIFRFDDPSGMQLKGDGFDGGYVSADSDDAEMLFISTYLMSPLYDLSNCGVDSELTLEFCYDYPSAMSSAAALEYSKDEGETWEGWNGTGMLESYDPDELGMTGVPFKPVQFKEDMTTLLYDTETVMFRVRYEAQYDWHFALDNWKFYDAAYSGTADVNADEMRLGVNGRVVTVKGCGTTCNVSVYDMAGCKIAESGDITAVTLPAAGIYTVRAQGATAVRTWKIAVK